jgi:CO dehydrogenase maturation factor
VAFLREHAGEDLLAWLGHEPAIRAMEQGRPFTLTGLSTATMDALAAIQARLDAQPRDWDKYARQAAELHVKNARAWANTTAGEDLTTQVDPGFTLRPHTQPA